MLWLCVTWFAVVCHSSLGTSVIQERGPLRAGQTAHPRGLTVWPEENCSLSLAASYVSCRDPKAFVADVLWGVPGV